MQTRTTVDTSHIDNTNTAAIVVENLSNAVNDIFDAQASNINNGSVETQINFLRDEGFTDDEIREVAGADVFSSTETEVLYHVVDHVDGKRTTEIWVTNSGDDETERDEAFDFYEGNGTIVETPDYEIESITKA